MNRKNKMRQCRATSCNIDAESGDRILDPIDSRYDVRIDPRDDRASGEYSCRTRRQVQATTRRGCTHDCRRKTRERILSDNNTWISVVRICSFRTVIDKILLNFDEQFRDERIMRIPKMSASPLSHLSKYLNYA